MRRLIPLTAAVFLLWVPAAQAHTVSATATCGSVTFKWTNFASSGSGNNGQNTPNWNIVFTPSGGGAPYTASGTETFSGSGATLTEPIPAGNGTVVASSAWTSSQTRDGNSNSGSTTIPLTNCASITVVKAQLIAGSGAGYTTSPLTGKVGQTVDYLITVTNTGSVPVSLNFSDAHCDPGTIVGPIGSLSSGKLAPGTSVVYTCLHVLVAGDAPQYTNTATEVATPPAGPPLTVPSNTVVVNLTPAPTPSPGTSPPVTSVGAVTTTKAACIAAAAKVSSITRVGSTAHTFVVRIKAAGISRVTFLLDNRKLVTLTKANARGGYLSVRINGAGLSPGMHHITARVALSNSSCAHVSRNLAFRRLHAVLIPAFTG